MALSQQRWAASFVTARELEAPWSRVTSLMELRRDAEHQIRVPSLGKAECDVQLCTLCLLLCSFHGHFNVFWNLRCIPARSYQQTLRLLPTAVDSLHRRQNLLVSHHGERKSRTIGLREGTNTIGHPFVKANKK